MTPIRIVFYFLFLITFIYVVFIAEFSPLELKIRFKPHIYPENQSETYETIELIVTESFFEALTTELDDANLEYKEEIPIECQLPNLEPFAEPIFVHMLNILDVNCSNGLNDDTPTDGKSIHYTFPVIFETDLDSTLILVRLPENFGMIGCCYKNFSRVDETVFQFSETCYPVNKSHTIIPKEHEFIAIYCVDVLSSPFFLNESKPSQDPEATLDNNTLLVDMFNFVHLKPEVEERLRLMETKSKDIPIQNNEKLNIVIFGIDSVSHMNFIRTMPLTRNYITKELDAFYMNGFTSLKDCSFPNLIATLTGLSLQDLATKYNILSNYEDKSYRKSYFDQLPFIWKNFSEIGYITSYAEDSPWMGNFKYMNKGFIQQPTDYYLNTLTNAQDKKLGHNELGAPFACYGPRLGYSVMLNNLKKTAYRMQNHSKPYFQLSWTNSLTHDYLTTPMLGDSELFTTLKWFNESGYFNNTIFIMMSDHGMRYGEIRKTYQGKIEERMPFLYFLLPNWFKRKFSNATKNLKSNQERLTTTYDLYETLKQFLYLPSLQDEALSNEQNNLEKSEKFPRGISLFLPIPARRTCKDIGLNEHYCFCGSMKPISSRNFKVIQAANSAVSYINTLLKPYPNCSTLKLKDINNAYVNDNPLSANNIVIDSETYEEMKNKYNIIFVTSPNDAILEATILKVPKKTKFRVAGDISRLNHYGDQSYCVKDHEIKKYCFCKAKS